VFYYVVVELTKVRCILRQTHVPYHKGTRVTQ